jgi:tight adherence protein B
MAMLVTFMAGVLVIVAIYSLVSDLYLRDRSRASKRVDEEFRQRQRQRVQQSSLFKNLGQLAAEAEAEEAALGSLNHRFQMMVEQSGLNIRPQQLLTLALVIGLGLGTCAYMARGLVTGVVLGGMAGLAPIAWVRIKQKARMGKFLGQLPDAFDLMARIIRAGQTMSQALQGVADEFEPPIAAEFAYCYEQQNLGLAPETALRDLARRTGLVEIKIFVLALIVQQQTGGNLAELLEKLATVVRERSRMNMKIKALTAEGRFQAGILLLMPPGLFGMILLMNRDYGQILLERPILLVTVAVLELLGALWIRKIVTLDY